MNSILLEVITIVVRSLASVLERVWVNFFMLILVAIIPENTLANYNVVRGLAIVFGITLLVIVVRNVVAKTFNLANPEMTFGASVAMADQKYQTKK